MIRIMNSRGFETFQCKEQIELSALVFDLDDTLYPEIDYVRSGFTVISGLLESLYGLKEEDCYKELMETFDKGIRGKNFNAFLDERGLDYSEDIIVELVGAYREHKPKIALPEVSKRTLVSLREKGFKLGLLTDGFLEAQKKKVESLGLESFFDAIVYSDMLGKESWKPSAIPFVEITRMLEVSGKECGYIADNPEKDFKGAKECGMLAIQTVHWARRDCASVPEAYRPDIVIDSLEILPKLVCYSR